MKINKIFLFMMIPALFTLTELYGQKAGEKIKITGRVVDGTDASIANAIIMVDGQLTRNVTDKGGFYKIKISPETRKIGVFTYTNGSIEEALEGRNRINFKFAGSVPDQYTDKIDPSEELVDNGITTIRRRALTTSVGKIDGTKPKYASYNSIYDMIKGEVPGVHVNGTSIMIRGATSLYGSTEPLLVVDGMPVVTIDNIEPRMVKSIQVLKGSAASIYGSRGSNGVIVINLLGADD